MTFEEFEKKVDFDWEIKCLCDGSMSLTSKDIAKWFYELGLKHANSDTSGPN